jgi:transmembrane sensor
MTDRPSIIPERLEEAIRWHTRLTSRDEGESDWQEFTLWLETNPENRIAYEQVEQISSSIDHLPMADAGAEPSPGLLPHRTAKSARRPSYLWLGAVVALAATVLLLVALPRQQPPLTGTEYSTRIGQTRSIRLADGSELDLNTATTLRALIDRSQRRVVLLRGEVLFHVAKDPALPFQILVAQQRLRVVGTVFDVLRTDHKLTVTVAQGRVLFSNASGGNAVSLLPGDQLVYRRESGLSITHVPAGTASAWRNGYLIYENASLRDIADDLSRYFTRKVVVADGPAASQKFSGILRMDREEAVLERLSHLLPITPASARGGVVLLRSSAAKD